MNIELEKDGNLTNLSSDVEQGVFRCPSRNGPSMLNTGLSDQNQGTLKIQDGSADYTGKQKLEINPL